MSSAAELQAKLGKPKGEKKPKTGGRGPGTPNRKTQQREERMAAAEQMATELIGAEEISTMQPLDILVAGMRIFASAGNWSKACEVAADAAIFVHPRLSILVQKTFDRGNIREMSNAQLMQRLAQLDAILMLPGEEVAEAGGDADDGDRTPPGSTVQ